MATRRHHNLEGIVRDIEHVLEGKAGEDGEDFAARFVSGVLALLDGAVCQPLAQTTQRVDVLSDNLDRLEARLDDGLDDEDGEEDDIEDDEAPEPGRDGRVLDSPPHRVGTTARRPAVEPERRTARAGGVDDGDATPKPPARRLLKR